MKSKATHPLEEAENHMSKLYDYMIFFRPPVVHVEPDGSKMEYAVWGATAPLLVKGYEWFEWQVPFASTLVRIQALPEDWEVEIFRVNGRDQLKHNGRFVIEPLSPGMRIEVCLSRYRQHPSWRPSLRERFSAIWKGTQIEPEPAQGHVMLTLQPRS